MPATQAQIARKLGLSRSTVAACLNPESKIQLTDETRSLVLAEAERQGYRPHRYAQIMRAGASGLIGVFHFGGLSQVVAERVWHASHAVQAAGYQVLTSDASWAVGGVKAACEAMIDARVEGIIVTGLSDPQSVRELNLLQRAKIPMVTLSGNEVPNTPQIRADAGDAFRRLVLHLTGKGRRRLLLLFTLPHSIKPGTYNWTGVERQKGFRAGLASAKGREVSQFSDQRRVEGIALGLDYVPDRFDPFLEARKAALAAWPRLKPDAILCGNDDWAIGTLSALRELGVAVPGEVALTGFDNTAVGAYLDIPLTTAAQPSRQMAEKAVEVLLQKIQGQRVPSGILKFPCELIIRQSCGKRFPY